MTLGEFRKQTKDLADDTVVALAEVDEVAGFNVSAVETTSEAKVIDAGATGSESVEFAGGRRAAVILRY